MKIIHLEHPFQGIGAPCVAAVGSFDGLHLGHQGIIERAKNKAEEMQIPSCVITFHPHPRAVLNTEEISTYITPLPEKIEILREMGIDQMYIIHFTPSFSQLSAEDFINSMILPMEIKHIVVGFDFRFGKGGVGNPELLQTLGKGEFSVDVVEAIRHENQKVSSSLIRSKMRNGEMEQVSFFLNRPFVIRGRVIEGEKRGRKLGFPTANIELLYEYFLPANGVYGVKVYVEGASYLGVMNIGYIPTFNNESSGIPFIEVHLLDFEGDLYGKELKIEVYFYIRSEKKFSSIEELIKQIERDILFAKEKFICYTN